MKKFFKTLSIITAIIVTANFFGPLVSYAKVLEPIQNNQQQNTKLEFIKSLENETFPQKLIEIINNNKDFKINKNTTFKEFFYLINKSKAQKYPTKSNSFQVDTEFSSAVEKAINTVLEEKNTGNNTRNLAIPFTQQSLNRYEIIICASNPSGCTYYFLDGRKATDYINQKYCYDSQVSGDGTRSNALKHAYWSGLLSRDVGTWWAENFTTAHEMYDLNSPNFDIRSNSEMDMFNNQKGRELSYDYCYSVPVWTWWGTYYYRNCSKPSDNIIQSRANSLLQQGRLRVLYNRDR